MLVSLASAVAALPETPPAGGTDWFPVVSAVVVVALGLIGQLLLRRPTRDKLIASASEEVVTGAKGMLEEYRTDLNDARAQMVELRERIAKLEQSLTLARAERERIETERQKALVELARVQQRVEDLENQLRVLERSVEKRKPR